MKGRTALLWLGVLLVGDAGAGADTAAEGHAWLATQVERLNAGLTSAPAAAAFIDSAVDLERFAELAFGRYVERSLADFEDHLSRGEYRRYVARHEERVRQALRQRLIEDLVARFAAGQVPAFELAASKFSSRAGTVVLRPRAGHGPAVRCRVRRSREGRWRLVDLDIDGRRLSAHYRKRFARTLDRRHSPAVLESELRGWDYVRLEDFSASTPGEPPLGWRWRDRDEDKQKPYRVRRQGGMFYVAAQDSGRSVILLRFGHWNPRTYPIMTWCWRAEALPPGGDERFGHTNDSAAGVYVFFSQNWIGLPRQIKYVWSTTLPVDTVDRRKRIARPWFVVVESGPQRLGQWRFEVVDLERDYARTYGGRPHKRTQGLGLLTDANSTDSYAEAYYADLRVWTREAFEQGRVRDTCDCYRALGSLTDTDTGGPAARRITP